MPELFDDSPGTIFASAAGLIVYFGRVPSIPVAWAISEKEGKVQLDQNVSFSRGRGKLFVLKQCWPFSRFNASAHLRMFWEDLGVISWEPLRILGGRFKKWWRDEAKIHITWARQLAYCRGDDSISHITGWAESIQLAIMSFSRFKKNQKKCPW